MGNTKRWKKILDWNLLYFFFLSKNFFVAKLFLAGRHCNLSVFSLETRWLEKCLIVRPVAAVLRGTVLMDLWGYMPSGDKLCKTQLTVIGGLSVRTRGMYSQRRGYFLCLHKAVWNICLDWDLKLEQDFKNEIFESSHGSGKTLGTFNRSCQQISQWIKTVFWRIWYVLFKSKQLRLMRENGKLNMACMGLAIHGARCVAVVRVTRNQAQRKRRNSREIA